MLCWSERTEPLEVYPEGINGAIASYFRKRPGVDAREASIDDPEQGIGKAALESADVLIWWGHRRHKDLGDARVAEAVKQIKERGLGFIAIHSSHYSKIFISLLESPCGLGGWRNDGAPEHLHCLDPLHPIADGVRDFTVPHSEMYNEPFQVPPPEHTIFTSSWDTGEKFRSCNAWTVGRARVVYFGPGHETFPIYFEEKPLKVVANSVVWCARRT